MKKKPGVYIWSWTPSVIWHVFTIKGLLLQSWNTAWAPSCEASHETWATLVSLWKLSSHISASFLLLDHKVADTHDTGSVGPDTMWIRFIYSMLRAAQES